jgi:branched-chain amino acid transport system permease protein
VPKAGDGLFAARKLPVVIWPWLAAGLLPLALALTIQDPFILSILAMAGAQALFVAGWDFIGGISGQISLGHALPFGAGAYAAAFLSAWGPAPPGAAIVGGALAGAMAGALQGRLGAHLNRVALALLTLATAEAARQAAGMLRVPWPGGIIVGGEAGVPGAVWPLDEAGAARLTAAVLAAALGGLLWITRSKLGLIIRLVRADERTAGASGIDVAHVRIASFAFGGGIAGLAGGLVASLTGRAPLNLLSLEWSLFALAAAGAGGLGTIVGPAFMGYALAVALQWLDLPATLRLTVIALLVILPLAAASAGARERPFWRWRTGIPDA